MSGEVVLVFALAGLVLAVVLGLVVYAWRHPER